MSKVQTALKRIGRRLQFIIRLPCIAKIANSMLALLASEIKQGF
jgi:hypothetical protein